MNVRPAKTQISLGIRPVWSESLLCTQWVAKDPSFLHADSEDSDQTGPMPRLVWVFAGRTLILLVLSCRGSSFYFVKNMTRFCHCLSKSCTRWPLRVDSISERGTEKWSLQTQFNQANLCSTSVRSESLLSERLFKERCLSATWPNSECFNKLE